MRQPDDPGVEDPLPPATGFDPFSFFAGVLVTSIIAVFVAHVIKLG